MRRAGFWGGVGGVAYVVREAQRRVGMCSRLFFFCRAKRETLLQMLLLLLGCRLLGGVSNCAKEKKKRGRVGDVEQ